MYEIIHAFSAIRAEKHFDKKWKDYTNWGGCQIGEAMSITSEGRKLILWL
jgi:hypothetical protein